MFVRTMLVAGFIAVSGAAYAQNVQFPILPIEQVTQGAMPSVGEFGGCEGILRFVSSVPLACSAVYGKTKVYGQLSVDSDMNGGAHSDHHASLTNLEPDTVYHFRVQGTGEDGRLFASQDMTFRTPPRDTSKAVNLLSLEAGAKVVAVSSNFGGGSNDASWGAQSAIDGKRSTEWATNGDGNAAFIEIALANKSTLDAIEVWTRTMSDGTAQISTFSVETDTRHSYGPFTLKDASKPFRFNLKAVASKLRLVVNSSSGGNTGLVEIAAYGKPIAR